MNKYRKLPVTIEAVQFDGTNHDSIVDWIFSFASVEGASGQEGSDPHLLIETLEGTMRANVGDWIIRGVQNEAYPCANAIFLATYEKVDS